MNDIDDLLAKQLAGENSPDEAAAVQTWLAESPDNQRYFVIESRGIPPTKEALIEALGRKAKFYKVLNVEPTLIPRIPSSTPPHSRARKAIASLADQD